MAGKSNTGKSGFLHDDSRLHKLCQDGNYRKVTEFVNAVPDAKALEDRLSNRKGVFGYTPLHEAVASGHHKVLDFLLQRAGDGHVNCRANSGYTPLHLAASSGHSECVRVLLRHSADISVTDEYGKTPKQTAELSSKSSIVRILRSAGETGATFPVVCDVWMLGDYLGKIIVCMFAFELVACSVNRSCWWSVTLSS